MSKRDVKEMSVRQIETELKKLPTNNRWAEVFGLCRDLGMKHKRGRSAREDVIDFVNLIAEQQGRRMDLKVELERKKRA